MQNVTAEALVDLAETTMVGKKRVIEADDLTDHQISLVYLSIKFAAMPLSFRLRAIVEEWPLERIIREIF